MRKISVIVDLQYGSTGKGLIAGFLATRKSPDVVITSWAANAGHTYIDPTGHTFVHTMLANGVVSPGLRRLMMGPGSLIDPVNLQNELDAARALGLLDRVDILIHPHAAIITAEHRRLEQGPMTKIGSTKKGVGEAMIQRIRRDPDNQNIASIELRGTALHACVCTLEQWTNALAAARSIQIEGAQGVGLSLYHGFYPYVTSRDVSTFQIFADAGIPFEWVSTSSIDVIGTLRTFPIRVANRYDDAGNLIGHSGPHYPDQYELDWSELGIKPELTTVTRLPRRIFTFSWQQIKTAARIAGTTQLFLNFANYLNSTDEVVSFIHKLESEIGCPVGWVGLGPRDDDVVTCSNDDHETRQRIAAKFVTARDTYDEESHDNG